MTHERPFDERIGIFSGLEEGFGRPRADVAAGLLVVLLSPAASRVVDVMAEFERSPDKRKQGGKQNTYGTRIGST